MDNQKTLMPGQLDVLATLEPQRWLSGDRPDTTLVAWRDDDHRTLGQLRRDVTALWCDLAGTRGQRWAVCQEDGYGFLVALLALWHCGKIPVIPGDRREHLLEEQRDFFDGVISDIPLSVSCPLIVSRLDSPMATAPLPAMAADARLILFTSGSTGRPMAVTKTLRAMTTETGWLAALLRDRWPVGPDDPPDRCRLVSSVTHRHLYGLSCGIFLPMSLGIPFALEMARYPEHLIRLCARHPVLFISSPALLTRLDRALPAPRCLGVFSAGGPLPWPAARQAEQWLNTTLTEIYGTTETGVLAWRRRRREADLWQPFGDVAFHAAERRVRATSALIAGDDGLWLDDRLEFSARGQGFQLAGRDDRVINIEEKRVSLGAIEQRLTALAEVAEAVVVPLLKNGRHTLGAALVLSAAGRAAQATGSLPALVTSCRRRLATWLEPMAVPRYWRIVDAIPRTARGKYDQERLTALFFTKLPVELSRRIPCAEQAELLLKLEPALFWFRGHFPGQPILPGVAQVDWVLHYGREALMADGSFGGIENVKFQRPVKPGQTLRLQLEWQAQRQILLFRYRLCDPRLADEPMVSSGRITLCR